MAVARKEQEGFRETIQLAILQLLWTRDNPFQRADCGPPISLFLARM